MRPPVYFRFDWFGYFLKACRDYKCSGWVVSVANCSVVCHFTLAVPFCIHSCRDWFFYDVTNSRMSKYTCTDNQWEGTIVAAVSTCSVDQDTCYTDPRSLLQNFCVSFVGSNTIASCTWTFASPQTPLRLPRRKYVEFGRTRVRILSADLVSSSTLIFRQNATWWTTAKRPERFWKATRILSAAQLRSKCCHSVSAAVCFPLLLTTEFPVC